MAAGILAARRSAGAATIAAITVAAALSGHAAAARDQPPAGHMPTGHVVMVGVAVADPSGGGEERRVVVAPSSVLVGRRWEPWVGPRLMVTGVGGDLAAGEPVAVDGELRPASLRTRRGWVGGVIEADVVTRLGEASNPLLRIGNRLRHRVLGSLVGVSARPGGALVSGFLIGDTGGLEESDAEALRLAGLSHFVAVSGSNVALFLGAWWLAAGPLAWGPRRRAIAGLVGLAVFVVVTRWEPSVLRAATMAAIVLGGRLIGRVISPLTALARTVTALVVIDGGLVGDVGFQLSVVATAGILVGLPRWPARRPRWAWAPLAATLSAQTAVAPLLLIHFGTVPLFAPLTNLVCAPLVALATVLGGVGAVLGSHRLVASAAGVAGVVLDIARGAADLPQLGVTEVILGLGIGFLAVGVRWLRPLVAIAAVVVAAVAVAPPGLPDGPVVSFLDVGQGDAALLRGPSGEVILIDGGPDAALLRSHLRAAGVRRIDLLVITHLHADHTTGLLDLAVPVMRVWHAPQVGEGPPFDDVVDEQIRSGAEVGTPPVGTVGHIGSFTVEVVAPVRRYASPNDGSLVVWIEAGGASILFSGDIEAVAQVDLGALPADILKVPHQGAATSDLDWIRRSMPRIAVISVGDNDYGHPSPEVVAALEEGGAIVYRTDRDGTVTFRLDRLAPVAALPSPR
ncbi:MAG: ComEC/Rec2 family competence protein [Acidimicrobiia bacterium]|nr:ComEC/Rec2 family competence protein [Acidimicrobiia bacterium]